MSQPTLLELVELVRAAAYARGEVVGTAAALGINPGPLRARAIAEYGEQVDRHRAEIERRLNLAKEDHPIMWRTHLDDNARSRSRQLELLRQRARDQREGHRNTVRAAGHVHPSVLLEYGNGSA